MRLEHLALLPQPLKRRKHAPQILVQIRYLAHETLHPPLRRRWAQAQEELAPVALLERGPRVEVLLEVANVLVDI
jgi:hypothetical protein